MTAPSLWFQPLGLRHWRFARRLAADPSVREVSWDRRPPTTLGHARWMWRWTRGAGPDRVAWVVRAAGFRAPVGMVRIERRPPPFQFVGEISVALIAAARGRGYGAWAIREATERALASGSFSGLEATMRPGNPASQRAFRAAGYYVGRYPVALLDVVVMRAFPRERQP